MNARMYVAGLLLHAAVSPASAAPITTLYSTGQAATGAADPHYSITGVTGATYTPQAATVFSTADGVYPISGGVWALGTDTPGGTYPTNSKWIGPNADASQNWATSVWTYQTTFDLNGFDPASAVIRGAIAADNSVRILLNGTQVAYFLQGDERGYTTSSFQSQLFAADNTLFPNLFQAGTNTLTFIVQNGNTTNDLSAPTGLRVALSGTADPSAQPGPLPTPEPVSAATLGLAVAGATGYIRRRRSPG